MSGVDLARVDEPLLRHLLQEQAHGDRQATEALFLSYTLDLGFFEKYLLHLCRSSGAAITIVGDPKVWRPDPAAVEQAGRAYHVGLAASRSAFHPKLMLLVGPKRVLAVVGSGNLTPAGWHRQDELWTVLSGDLDACPSALFDLRDVLRKLTKTDALDPISQDGVERACQELTQLLDNCSARTEPEHRLFASWNGALLDQLPTGPVDELRLHAPFHDPESRAIAAILERMQPSKVEICVQAQQTMLSPAHLEAVLAEYGTSSGAEIKLTDGDPETNSRYRHGKLIEWSIGGTLHALTGSPNLSVAALLLPAPRGNYELAIRSPIPDSLLPSGAEITLQHFEARSFSSPEETDGPLTHPVIHAASLERGQLSVHLTPWPSALGLEGAPYEAPTEWASIGSIPANQTSATFECDLSGGARLRLVDASTPGLAAAGPVQFVSDVRMVEQRLRPGPDQPVSTDPLAAFATLVSPELVEVLASMSVQDLETPPWSASDTVGMSTEQEEQEDEAESGPDFEAATQEPSEELQTKRRELCKALSRYSSGRDQAHFVRALAVLLFCWHHAVWEGVDDEPQALLEKVAAQLQGPAGANTQLDAHRDCLLAIALATLPALSDHRRAGDVTQTLKQRIRSFASFDLSLAAEYLTAIVAPGEQPLWLQRVIGVVEQSDRPFTEMIMELEAEAALSGGTMAVHTLSPSRVLVNHLARPPKKLEKDVKRIIGQADRLESATAWSSVASGDWAFAGWRVPDLFIATHATETGKTKWVHWELGKSLQPRPSYPLSRHAVDSGNLRNANPSLAAVNSFLERLGLDSAEPPTIE